MKIMEELCILLIEKEIILEKNDPKRSQGIVGMTMDNFLNEIDEEINHIKIDVDGNEDLVLLGSSKTLRKDSTKSILIELAPLLPNYKEIIRLIESSGFHLEFPKKNYLNKEIKTNPKKTINHIFKKILTQILLLFLSTFEDVFVRVSLLANIYSFNKLFSSKVNFLFDL